MDKQGFHFHNWATKMHLTQKTMSVLVAEEVDNLPALLLLEERDLHELFLPLGQRKLLLNAIGWLQNKRSVGSRRDSVNELYTPTPMYACKRYKSSPASSPASSYSGNKTKSSTTDESICSYNEDNNEGGCSEVDMEEQINTIIEEQFNTIMLVQSKNSVHDTTANSLNDNDVIEDVFEFNDLYTEPSRDELSDHITVEKVFEFKNSADEESTIEDCCEIDREMSIVTSTTDSDNSHSDTPSGKLRRNLPTLPPIKLPIKSNDCGMKHTVTLRLDFKSMAD